MLHFAPENRLRRETPFLAHIRFKNDLPEIPSDPKMLVSQIQPETLAQFSLTALERQAKRDLLAAPAILISPLDTERYQVPDQPAQLEAADLALLKEEARAVGLAGGPMAPPPPDRHKGYAVRAAGMSMDKCSWLMRTTYISSADNRVFQKQGLPEKMVLQAKAAERRAAGVREPDDEDRELNDRGAQIVAIEASFAEAQRPPVHARNPALKPVEILPVLPDVEAWSNKYFCTIFPEADPADEIAAAVGAEAVAAIPPQHRPHRLAGGYLLKGFTQHVGGGGEAGKGRELKIMALLLPQDLHGLVSQAQEQVAAADEQAAQLAAAAEPPPLAEQQPALFPVEAERLQGDYQWAKEYGYDLNRESVHYAVRLGKGAAMYYRMQGKLECRNWKDEEKLQRERIRKRNRGGGADDDADDDDNSAPFVRPAKLVVSARPLREKELQERGQRQAQLAPQGGA